MKTEQEAIRIREAYLRAGSIKAAKRIADIIQAEGATLSARQVQRIASRIREDIRNSKSDDAKLITRGIPGCWQVDFGEMDCVIKGREIRAHLLILSSRYSNACVCTVCESEQSEALFDGLWRCFVSLGGVPPVLRFDNMAPVACWRRGRERKLTDAFSRFAVHCGFSPELCNPCSGWENRYSICHEYEKRVNRIRIQQDSCALNDLGGFEMLAFNGVRLTIARQYRCLTLEELSKKTGISTATIRKHESGKGFPTKENQKVYSQILKFPNTFWAAESVEPLDVNNVSASSKARVARAIAEKFAA